MIDTTKKLPNKIVMNCFNLGKIEHMSSKVTQKSGIHCTNSQLSLISLNIHLGIQSLTRSLYSLLVGDFAFNDSNQK